MGAVIRIKSAAPDGFTLDAWREEAVDARRGAVVLICELDGITPHIRDLARGFAADGYETLAPALFDRRASRVESGNVALSALPSHSLSEATAWDHVAGDLAAAVAALKPPVFVVGYGWGGAVAWLAACRVAGVAAVSIYDGGGVLELLGEMPACPIILHFGLGDALVPTDVIEAIGAAHPDMPIHLYETGRRSASDCRADLQSDAMRLARLRTLRLFALNGVGRGDF